tara:strand:- start:1080 stop:1439 length:360 start_codon:yes stop_codon:yes gene_type:complete
MDNIQQYIVDWVKTDKQLKQLNKESGDLRKQKDTIQCNLLPLIQENNLQENVFSIPALNVDISCKESSTYETISYKYLEEKFNDYFDTYEEANKLLIYLKENRKKNTFISLKSNILKSG